MSESAIKGRHVAESGGDMQGACRVGLPSGNYRSHKAFNDFFNGSKRPAERESDEGSERETDPKDWLGEKCECAVAVPRALHLFEEEVSTSDRGEQRQLGDLTACTMAQRPEHRAGERCEYPEGRDEPDGLEMPVCNGRLVAGERRQCVRALVDEENADSGEKDRVDTRHDFRLREERSKWAAWHSPSGSRGAVSMLTSITRGRRVRQSFQKPDHKLQPLVRG